MTKEIKEAVKKDGDSIAIDTKKIDGLAQRFMGKFKEIFKQAINSVK